MTTVQFLTDAGDFLAAAGEWLAARPVEVSVVSAFAERTVREAADGIEPKGPFHWWVVVRDEVGSVVGAAMRTAPFEPYPPYFLSMPHDAALLLARALHERGETLLAANGVLPAARLVAEETARLVGGTARVFEHTRLWELGTLTEPTGVPGLLRPARPGEAALALAWFDAFGAEAAEQAGHTEPHPSGGLDEAGMLRRIDQGLVWLWEVDGEVVHVTGCNVPSYGVARIGPVLTPKQHRGRGYAAAAVAGVSRHLLDQGARVCLFTDVDNPVSNRIYEAIGFRPLADTANYVVA